MADDPSIRASVLQAASDWGEEAYEVNSELLRRDPRDRAAALRLARCLEARGEWAKATGLYRALPGSGPARERLRLAQRVETAATRAAEAFARAGTTALRELRAEAEAADDRPLRLAASQLLVREQRDAGTLVALAGAWRSVGERGNAERALIASLAVDPAEVTNVAAYTLKAALLADDGRLDEAERLLERLERRHRNDAAVLATRASVHRMLATRSGEEKWAASAAALWARSRSQEKRSGP